MLETMSINGKNIHVIGVFIGNNLNFRIRDFTWGLANNRHICKNYEKPGKHIILSNLIQEIIQYQICKGSHNAKVLQLDQQHEVPTFFLQMCKMLNIYQIPISVLTPLKLKKKQCVKNA